MTQTLQIYEAEQILGLTGTYTLKDMQAAYRQKIKHAHPDVGGSAEEAAKINAAKETLEPLFAGNESRVVTCGSGGSGSSQRSQAGPAATHSASSTARSEETRKSSSTWSEEDWQSEPQAKSSERTFAEMVSDALRARRERKAAKPPLMARTWFVCTLFYFIGACVIGPILVVAVLVFNGFDFNHPQSMSSEAVQSMGMQLTVLALFVNIASIAIGKWVARKNRERFYSS